MATNTVCGRCGTLLPTAFQPCPRCGAGAAASSVRPAIKRKSPALAAALATIPGLGHLYLGHPLKALFYFVGSGGLEFFGFDFDLTAIGATIGLPMGLTGFALWIHGIVDAYQEAKRTQIV